MLFSDQVERGGDAQSQRPIELQTVLTRITKMKLPRTPGRVLRRGPRATLICIRADPAAFHEFLIHLIDIGHDETIGRAIGRICPLLFVGPLNMQLNAVAPHGNILRIYWRVLKHHRKPKALVEAHHLLHITCRKNWMDRLKIGSHGCSPSGRAVRITTSSPKARPTTPRNRDRIHPPQKVVTLCALRTLSTYDSEGI